MKLPSFKYHPDPVATGSIIKSKKKCFCCKKAAGYVCPITMFSQDEVGEVCPWCIASGEAAKKFQGEFVDVFTLAGVSKARLSELAMRTPSYSSMQQPEWRACCKDACEYHGLATQEELSALSKKDLRKTLRGTAFVEEDIMEAIAEYTPGFSSLEFHKFVCRHCKDISYHIDLD